MIPAEFEYRRPESLQEALHLLDEYGDDAKLLAGGHSLIPAMKLRLAQPRILIDISRLKELRYIREADGGFEIGALTTHYDLETDASLRDRCPLLPATAAVIGDPQVRNWGTIGGSLAHADPAADWPAAILALDATLVIAGPGGWRSVSASEFFVDLFQTAIGPNEILCEVQVPAVASGAYVKTRQKASGFAVAGAAVVVERSGSVRVGITGVAAVPYRAAGVEEALAGRALSPEVIRAASRRAAEQIDPLEDMHASAEYRAHLACVNTARALADAARI